MRHATTQPSKGSSTLQDHIAASIFWLYIIAALYLSQKSIRTILAIPLSAKADRATTRRQLWLFSALATLAFAILSFNMLGILFQSFSEWASNRAINYSTGELPASIWQWSLDTKPFTRFILDIFADSPSIMTSVAALLSTLLLSIYMGMEGRRHDVPNLWAFFGLAQILPISFSSCLLFLAILRSGPTSAKVTFTPFTLLLICIGFVACTEQAVSLATDAQDSVWLIPLVVLARILLLFPLSFRRMPVTNADSMGSEDFLTLLGVIGGLIAVLSMADVMRSDWKSLGQYLLDRPAASTLSCDLFLTTFVCLLWRFRKQAPEKAD